MNELQFRAARPEDEAAVAALSAHIWEGEDYVPRQFASWVNDPYGQFTVVYEGQELVAFGKLTRLAAGEWWLEGLRVHPEHRGRGIARRLHHYAVEMADHIGSGILRFATNRENQAVHKLAYETGFQRVGTYMLCDTEPEAESSETGSGSFVAAEGDDLARLQRWLAGSPYFEAWNGLYEQRWKWYAFLPRLAGLLGEGRVHWWCDAQHSAQGLVVISNDLNGTLGVNYFDGVPSVLQSMATALRQPGLFGEAQRLRLKPPADDTLRASLAASGWEIEEYEMTVFERRLAATRSTET